MKSSDSDSLIVAKLGKTVGLKGELRLHLLSDFPEQFKKDSIFSDDKNNSLKIEYYNQKRGIVKFYGYDCIEDSSKLINRYLLSSIDKSFKDCRLNEGEHFWFELMGAKVIQGKEFLLGEIKRIERLTLDDYLTVKTDSSLVEKGFAKEFYIPYIDRYIDRFDKKNKAVYVKDALSILEAS